MQTVSKRRRADVVAATDVGKGFVAGVAAALDRLVLLVVSEFEFRPHLDANAEKNSELLYAYLKLAYAGRLRSRWNALSTLTQRLLKGNSFLRRP